MISTTAATWTERIGPNGADYDDPKPKPLLGPNSTPREPFLRLDQILLSSLLVRGLCSTEASHRAEETPSEKS